MNCSEKGSRVGQGFERDIRNAQRILNAIAVVFVVVLIHGLIDHIVKILN